MALKGENEGMWGMLITIQSVILYKMASSLKKKNIFPYIFTLFYKYTLIYTSVLTGPSSDTQPSKPPTELSQVQQHSLGIVVLH